jgi:hypothetical protein
MKTPEYATYVVYPAALLDGWEVVKECEDEPACFHSREEAIVFAKAKAVFDGGAVVKLENWYGDTETTWEVQPRPDRRLNAGRCLVPPTAA